MAVVVPDQTPWRTRTVAGQTQIGSALRVGTVPLTIPTAQAYYWSGAWQQSERETLASFEAGNGVTFDSDDPDDIVRWLHAPDVPDAG